MRKVHFVIILSVLVPLLACAALTMPGRELSMADSLFREDQYSNAVAQYRKVIRDYPDSSCAGDARFGLAATLAYYDNPQRDYAQALQEFEEFLRLFPDHAKTREAQNWRQVLKTLDHLKKNIEQLKRLDVKHEERRRR